MTPATTVAMLPIASVHESPTNPRKTFAPAELAELVESIRAKGVLSPVLVRSCNEGLQDGYELVFGARRFRAATAAGLEFIPAMVRQMSDQEVLEAQLVENSQRADVHPLEEADALVALHNRHGLSAEQLAEKLGKPRSYVHRRLALADLREPVREALRAGRILLRTAEFIGRLDGDAQARALEVVTPGWVELPMAYERARKAIETEVMLLLEGAPFDPADRKLVKAVGPCGSCPKRSGAQSQLFGEPADADRCTDPACFKRKADAAWAKRAAKHQKAGGMALEDAAADTAIRARDEYQNLDERCWDDPQQRTWREVIEAQDGKIDPSDVVLARLPNGSVRELVVVSKADAVKDAVVAARQADGEKRGSKSGPREPSEWERKQAATAARRAVVEQAIPELVRAAEEHAKPDDHRVLALALRMLLDTWGAGDVTGRREFDDEAALSRSVGDMTGPELHGLLLELAIPLAVQAGYSPLLVEACELLGVDLDEMDRAAGGPGVQAQIDRPAEEDAASDEPADDSDHDEDNFEDD